MVNYSDCVLRNELRSGKIKCYGLHTMLCNDGVKCPFYGSSKTHFRDPDTGFVHKKKGVK